jgi:hypothetical protein
VVRQPVRDALEAYAAERFGLVDAHVLFDTESRSDYGEEGRVDYEIFVITVYGETDGGEYRCIEFGSDEAVVFMDAAMAWERRS